MEKSKLWKLDLRDFLKGLVVAVIAAVITSVYTVIETGQTIFDVDWRVTLSVAITAGISYVLKNLSTNSEDKLLKKEIKKVGK